MSFRKPFAGILLSLLTAGTARAMPRISEFLASNDSVWADAEGEFFDWIEIHNPGVESFNLGGYYLTDDEENLVRWQFPAETHLPANGYLIVFASNKGSAPEGEWHANFKLSASGEFLGLVAPDGHTLVDHYSPDFPPQYADISYGRTNEGGLGYFLEPTPGAPNGGAVSDPYDTIGFIPKGGTFTGSQSVEISNGSPEAVIHFTTDGSDPTEASPVYRGDLVLDATTEIRAVAIVPGEVAGPVHSASYIRLADEVADFESPLPLIVLENFNRGNIPDKRAANPPAGDGGGITQVDRQAAQFVLIDRTDDGRAQIGGDATISSRIGIRVRGSSSASQPAKHESYSIESWGAENEETVDIEPFGMPADNDWILYAPYHFDRALVRNAFIYELSRRMGHYASRTQFVEVFINTDGGDLTMADYAGVYVFMEKIKQSSDRVDVEGFSDDGTEGGWMLESNRMDPLPADGSGTPPFNFHTAGPNRILEGPYGGSSRADRGGDDIPTGYNTFLNYVEPGGYDSSPEQRDAIVNWFETFEDALYGEDYRRPDLGYRAYLDTASFIDHYLLNNFSRNVDGLQLSTFMYRPDTHGKLHLNPVWDFDRSMDSYDSRDDATSGMWGQQFLWFPRLFSDPEFNQQFVDRWQELRQTTLSTTRIDALIDEMAAEITGTVAAANFARWNASDNRPRSGSWEAEITHLKSWLATRAAWIDAQFPAPPVIAEAGGQVTLASADPGTIYYTLDGSDPRLPDLPGSEFELLAEEAAGRGLIPSEDPGEAWKGGAEPFDDSGWIAGQGGIGFGYPDYVGVDVSGMRGEVGSAYLRKSFELDGASLSSLNGLVMNLRYEDGFVAYLNGVEVASDNRPASLSWDASTGGTSRLDSLAVVPASFDLSAHLGALKTGRNILAIQVMNSSVVNGDVLASPQLVGTTGSTGGSSGRAQVYSEALDLTKATQITARLHKDGAWSGPVEATFLIDTVPVDSSNLVISEIMYRPAELSPSEELAGYSDRDEFEFLELANISATETIDLSEVSFRQVDVSGDRQGIDFDFEAADRRFLPPGGRLVIVENREAFALRYGNQHEVAGQYAGALSNNGERLTLVGAEGTIIREFAYGIHEPWPTMNQGGSLVLINAKTNPDHDNPFSWVASVSANGSPGLDDSPVFAGEANVDRDGDGLEALVEFVLGTSDSDPNSGPDRIVGKRVGGEFHFSYTVDRRVNSVGVVPEISHDLKTWSQNSGALEWLSREENDDGSETFEWRPVSYEPGMFFRLRVNQ